MLNKLLFWELILHSRCIYVFYTRTSSASDNLLPDILSSSLLFPEVNTLFMAVVQTGAFIDSLSVFWKVTHSFKRLALSVLNSPFPTDSNHNIPNVIFKPLCVQFHCQP